MEANTNENSVISVIAHDLKDPINAISGVSEILLHNWDEVTDEEKLAYIEEIYQSSQRMQGLLEDLLIWSKGIANNFQPINKTFNIRDLLEKNLEFANLTAATKGIKITNWLEEEILVDADEDMISTVFRNLLANSIKYNDPGGEIQIKASVEAGFVKLCISDNGKGVSDPRVFALLNIQEKTGAEVPGYKRKGLGLILCKDFINRNGGKIWLESEPGNGSQFYFTVPLADN